jgi:hypothetical protein
MQNNSNCVLVRIVLKTTNCPSEMKGKLMFCLNGKLIFGISCKMEFIGPVEN